jgi:hypothetical protein
LVIAEQDEPRVLPALSQKEQLATLVEALLIEIAAALANGEVAFHRPVEQSEAQCLSAKLRIVYGRPYAGTHPNWSIAWYHDDGRRDEAPKVYGGHEAREIKRVGHLIDAPSSSAADAMIASAISI